MGTFIEFSIGAVLLSLILFVGGILISKKKVERILFSYTLILLVIVSISTYYLAQTGLVLWYLFLPGLTIVVFTFFFLARLHVVQSNYVIMELFSAASRGDMELMINLLTKNKRYNKYFESLEAFALRQNQIVEFVHAIGNGNLDSEFTIQSENDKVVESLITLKDHIKAFFTDTSKMVNEARDEGKLFSEVESKDHNGIWGEMNHSIGTLINSFSSPLISLNKVIYKMSQGDLTVRYLDKVKGDVLHMAQNLNSALGNIEGLLNQVSKNAMIIDQSSSEMKVSGEEMSVSTSEIASSIGEMSKGAQDQLMKIEEVSNHLEGILNSSSDIGRKSETIHEAARMGVEHSINGVEIVDGVVNSIDEISNFTHKANDSIGSLINRSSEISRALTVMEEIASQTNLLALNASIEAAQAGEAGRGFAVVADEINKLAVDAKKSVKEIEQVVSDVKSDTANTAQAVEEMSGSVRASQDRSSQAVSIFNEIMKASKNTLEFSKEILDAVSEQKNGVDQVAGLTEGIVVIAEQTAAGSEQMASSSSELLAGMDTYNLKVKGLAEISESFRNGVSTLKLSGKLNENNAIYNMKEAFEREKFLLDTLLNFMPDHIYFKDEKSQFLRVSRSMLKLHQLSTMDEILGKSDFDFFGEHAQNAFDDEMKIIQTKRPILNQVEKEDKKDGNVGYVSTTKMPLINGEGEVVGTFGISRDVTDFKLAELDIEEKARELAKFKQENELLKKELQD